MGIGEVIRGSLSAEVGSLLIGVVSHAGSPRPESPQRLGSIAHIGHVDEGLMREASAGEVTLYVAQALLPHPNGDTADSTRPLLMHSRHYPPGYMRSACAIFAWMSALVRNLRSLVLYYRLRLLRCWSEARHRRPGSGQ